MESENSCPIVISAEPSIGSELKRRIDKDQEKLEVRGDIIPLKFENLVDGLY